MNMRTQDVVLQANPKAGYLERKTEIDDAIQRVLASGYYILGEEVEAFEREFAQYIGVNHAIGVANGTDALEIALRACGVGPGDVVISVSHTAVATIAAIELVGATPFLVDIDSVTCTMDVSGLEAAIQQIQQDSGLGQLKAIIPVHLYGHPANIPAIMELANRHGLYVIEDCAQAHGATLNGRKIGTWGHFAAFSLYPTKNLGALGDAGIVVTNDAKLANEVLIQRQYGWRSRYISDVAGMNSRLDPVQAAVLRVRLRYLDQDNARRQQAAEFYQSSFADLPLGLPQLQGVVSHVYHQYVIRTSDRDALQDFLKTWGVGTAIHYPAPVHLQPAYQNRVPLSLNGLPVTEQLRHHILSLPMHPHLTNAELTQVANAMHAYHQN